MPRGMLRLLLLVLCPVGALWSPPPLFAQQAASYDVTSNWAGYVANNAYYTGVSALFQAPTPYTLQRLGVTASWVGIGGAESNDLLQAGLAVVQEGPFFGYEAWYETLPTASRHVAMSIGPGDWVFVDLHELAFDLWQVTVVDGSQVFQRRIRYASSHSTAEWILEEPALADGRLLPLGVVTGANFANMSAIANGQHAIPTQLYPRPSVLAGPFGKIKAAPTEIGPDGSSFSVATS